MTAYDQYAVAAFERAAVDYLLKPVSDERLAETVARLKAQRRPRAATRASARVLAALAQLRAGCAASAKLAWIRASRGAARCVLIDVDDVCYFQANDKYTSVFTADGESLIRTPLKELAEQLDARSSGRCIAARSSTCGTSRRPTRDLAGRVTLRMKSRPERWRCRAPTRTCSSRCSAAASGGTMASCRATRSSTTATAITAERTITGTITRLPRRDEAGRRAPRAVIALVLTAGFAVVEALGGWIAGSLALISDAGPHGHRRRVVRRRALRRCRGAPPAVEAARPTATGAPKCSRRSSMRSRCSPSWRHRRRGGAPAARPGAGRRRRRDGDRARSASR